MATNPAVYDFAKVQLRLTNILTSASLSQIMATVQQPDAGRTGGGDINETFRTHGLSVPDDTKVELIGTAPDDVKGFRVCVAATGGGFHCANITFHWPIEVDPG